MQKQTERDNILESYVELLNSSSNVSIHGKKKNTQFLGNSNIYYFSSRTRKKFSLKTDGVERRRIRREARADGKRLCRELSIVLWNPRHFVGGVHFKRRSQLDMRSQCRVGQSTAGRSVRMWNESGRERKLI